MILRATLPSSIDPRAPRRCLEPGCRRSTRHRKPYCPDHVERLPYVQEVLAALEGKEREQAEVAILGPRAVDPDGITAGEILNELAIHGPRSVARLAKDLALSRRLAEHYVEALRREGFVSVQARRRRRRDSAFVRLIPIEAAMPAAPAVLEEAAAG
ncbi:MAG: hypothetical protein AB7N76_03305 [Planctomycetota bacterium]